VVTAASSAEEPGEETKGKQPDLPTGPPPSREEEDDANMGHREQCIICMQSFHEDEMVVEPVREDCQHVFHKACIYTWLIRHDDCPYCRRDLLHFDDQV
jgi:Ring finger domain